MHGLTFFSVAQRTGGGLANLASARTGPTSFEFEDATHACPETRFRILVPIDGDWVWEWWRALCSEDSEFILASSHAGALHEAYSDIFAVSTGFFHEGAGALGSYEYGSEYAAGTVRSLSDPWSRLRDAMAYPYRWEFALAVDENDEFAAYSGALFLDRKLVGWPDYACCYDGSHWNSTIISHAFYLAIEGGTNLVTQLTVEGVGAANREQVERIFFRALTELMPQRVSFWLAADVIRQAAADLAAGTSVQQAVEEALLAVGLQPQPTH